MKGCGESDSPYCSTTSISWAQSEIPGGVTGPLVASSPRAVSQIEE